MLNALLDSPGMAFEGLSGGYAGAMNTVFFADGWIKGGCDGARQGVANFWTEVGKLMPWGSMTRGEGETISLTLASKLLANWAGRFSLLQCSPFELNPLRDLLVAHVGLALSRVTSGVAQRLI